MTTRKAICRTVGLLLMALHLGTLLLGIAGGREIPLTIAMFVIGIAGAGIFIAQMEQLA